MKRQNLTEITIPSSVTSIGDSAFCGCSKFEQIIFENLPSLTLIGSSAFYECSSLKKMTIPSSATSVERLSLSVTLINDNAFQKCSFLNKITITSSVKIGLFDLTMVNPYSRILFHVHV
ncbi:hypothetical protein M9Y10_003152 [Tritrichomonas musculus]|uniref:Surface antigen BspA-like n=1 Tax=Tritrichomonas musculus TaxID=1915356 RepID=A0ABR2JNS4_9EUKA